MFRVLPGHELAARQMEEAFGAMISFEMNGDFKATKVVCQSTKLFGLAVSLGAVESLIEQPASMSHASYDALTVFYYYCQLRILIDFTHPCSQVQI